MKLLKGLLLVLMVSTSFTVQGADTEPTLISNDPYTFEEFVPYQDVAYGYETTIALKHDNTLVAWGNNEKGTIGDGSTIDRALPVDITSSLTLENNETIDALYAGAYHVMVMTSNNRILAWGANEKGQLGNGQTQNVLSPIDITPYLNLNSGVTVDGIALGSESSYILTSTNQVLAFGDNTYGQLGNNTYTNSSVPINITSDLSLNPTEYIDAVHSTAYTVMILTNEQNILTFGYNDFGTVGNNSTNNVLLATNISSSVSVGTANDITEVVTGLHTFYVFTTDNRVIAWGANTFGQIGDGSTTNLLTPTDITQYIPLNSEESIVQWSSEQSTHVAVLTNQGRVLQWGSNYADKQLNSTTDRYSPEEITDAIILNTDEEILRVDALGTNIYVTTNQRLLTAGSNSSLQLCLNTVTTTIDSLQTSDCGMEEFVINDTPLYLDDDITDIYTHFDYSGFLTNTGDYYSFGTNMYSQIPYTYDNPQTTPVLFDVFPVTNVAVSSASIAITTDGSGLQTWGSDDFHTLADNTGGSRNNPLWTNEYFLLNAGETLDDVFGGALHMMALSSEGRLFSWGTNYAGQLGTGDTINYPYPQDITSSLGLIVAETITDVELGYSHSLVLTSNGRLFATGSGNFNQNGDMLQQDTSLFISIDTLFPLQVNETIIDVDAGHSHNLVLTSNQRVFAFGKNTSGQLGVNDTSQYILPVEVPISTLLNTGETISKIVADGDFSGVLTSDGRVIGWGRTGNAFGDGSQTLNTLTPFDFTPFLEEYINSQIVDFQARDHALFLTVDNELYTMGTNMYGNLGDGTTTNQTVPSKLIYSYNDLATIQKTEVYQDYALEDSELHVTLYPEYDIEQLLTSITIDGVTYNNQSFQFDNGSIQITIPNSYTELADYNFTIESMTFNNSTTKSVQGDTSFTISINTEITPPTFDEIPNQTIESGTADIDWTTYMTNISDNSGGTITLTEDFDNIYYNDPFPGGIYYVTVSATDESGNSTSQTFNVEVSDTTAPTFDPIPTQIIEAGDMIDWATVPTNVADNSDAEVSIFVEENTVDNDTPGTYSVTLGFSDYAGGYDSVTFAVEVIDTTAPTWPDYDNYIVEAGSEEIDWNTIFIALDNTDQPITQSPYTTTIDYDTVGSYSVTTEATDTAGWSSSETYNVEVVDTTAPTFEILENHTIEAGSFATIDWSVYISNMQDNSTSSLTPLEVEDNVDYNTPGTYSVIVSVVDESGNSIEKGINVTVEDTTIPEFDTFNPQTIESGTSLDIDWTTYITSVSDNSDGLITVTEEFDFVDYNTPGTYNVSILVSDESGNTAADMFSVMVEDTTAPSWNTDPITIEAGTQGIDMNSYFTVTDNSDGSVEINEFYSTVEYDTPGTYYVTMEAWDEYANMIHRDTTVIITDTTPPTFTPIYGDTIEAGDYDDFDWTTVIHNINDNSTGVVTVEETLDTVDYDTTGWYSVQITLSDAYGNSVVHDIQVGVEDTTPPTISMDNQIVEINDYTDVDWTTWVTEYSDNSSEPLVITEFSDNVHHDTIGIYYVNLEITDASGNKATTAFQVDVVDTTPPVWTVDFTTIEAGTVESFRDHIESTISDNSKGVVTTVETGDIPYDTIGEYTTTITFTDPSGNSASGTYTFEIIDTTNPTVSPPSTTVIQAGEYEDIDWTTHITEYSDNATGSLALVEGIDNIIYDTVGLYDVFVTVTDESLNQTTLTFQVEVHDTVAPMFDVDTLPEIEAGANDIDWTMYIINLTDNATGNLTTTESSDLIDYDTPGTYNVILEATDESLNKASKTIEVTIVDTTPPNIVVNQTTIEAGMYESIDDFIVLTDNSDLEITYTDDYALDYDTPGTYNLHITAIDGSENTSEADISFTVEDTTPPTITADDQVIQVGHHTDIDWTSYVTVTDNSDVTLIISEITDQVDYNTLGDYVVEVEVKDSASLTNQVTINVSVIDTTPPTYEVMTIEPIESHSVIDIDWTTYITSVTDNSKEVVYVVETEDSVLYDTVGIYIVTVTITDINGNTALENLEIVIEDTTSPTHNITNQTREAGVLTDQDWAEYFTTNIELYEISDLSGDVTIIEQSDAVDYNTPGVYDVQVILTDIFDNETQVDFSVTITDTTSPTAEIEESFVIEAGNTDIDWISYFENIQDNSDSVIEITEVDDSVVYNVTGTYSVELSVEDASGNKTEYTIFVTVEDTTPPVLDAPESIVYEIGTERPTFTDLISAYDIVDGDLTTQIFFNDSNVDYEAEGEYVLSLQVTDSSGNLESITIPLTVEDTTPPVITLDACLSTIYINDTYTDCGVTIDDEEATLVIDNPVDTSTLGSYTVTYTATDPFGNSTSIIRKVHVVEIPLQPEFILDSTMTTITVNIPYQDGTCSVKIGDLTEDCVTEENNVDITQAGVYTIVYSYTYNDVTYYYTRYVFVVDGVVDITLYTKPKKDGDWA